MKKLLFLLLLPIAFSSCSEVLTSLASTPAVSYSKVSITSVRLNDFPPKQASGLSWDPLGGKPDIYCTLKIDDVVTRLQTNDNISIGDPLIWGLAKPYTITNLMSAVTIAFYDQDGDLSNDDYMGRVVLVPARYRAEYPKYPTTVTLVSQYAPYVKVTLGLRWE
jgi:hypothetical protein